LNRQAAIALGVEEPQTSLRRGISLVGGELEEARGFGPKGEKRPVARLRHRFRIAASKNTRKTSNVK
jgi:hypothetical protein